MSVLRRVGWLGTMAAGCVLLLCAIAQAQVLDQLPEDTLCVFKARKAQAINVKLIALLQRLGVAQMFGADAGLQDPLGKLTESVKDGLDKNGDIIGVSLNGDFSSGQPTPTMFLLPITDYQAMLSNFEDRSKDGDFDVVHTKDHRTVDLFVADWGKYAAFSEHKEWIKKGTGIKLSDACRKEMESKDVSVYINIKTASDYLMPLIEENKPRILRQIATAMQAAPNGNEDMTGVMQAVVKQAFAGAEHLLSECSGVVLSGNLGDDGINFSGMAEFSAGSYLGKLVQGMHNTQGSFTGGLPAGKYIFYGGGNANAAQVVQLIDDIAGPIVAELAQASPDKAKIANGFLQGLRTVRGNTQMKTFGFLAPSGALGQSSLIQALIVVTGDTDKIAEGQKTALACVEDFVKMLTTTAGAPFKISVINTPDAKTISGISFSQVQVKIEGGENDPAAAQVQQMHAMMYGPGGASTLFGKVDDKHMLGGIGVDDAALAAAVGAVKDNADPLGKLAEMQVVNKNLPRQRAAAIYLCADVLANTGADYARQVGMAVPQFQLKPNLPPIGFTIGSQQSVYRVECFVPAELLESLSAGWIQMRMGPPPQPERVFLH